MWTQFLWRRWVGPREPKNRIMRFMYQTSSAIVWNATARSVLFVIVSSMLSISSLINLAECDYSYSDDPLNPIILDENCIAPWVSLNYNIRLLFYSGVELTYKCKHQSIRSVLIGNVLHRGRKSNFNKKIQKDSSKSLCQSTNWNQSLFYMRRLWEKKVIYFLFF